MCVILFARRFYVRRLSRQVPLFLWFGGSWCKKIFEAEQPLMGRYIKKLYEKSKAKDSYYTGIWIMHYTEDVSQKAYNNQWSC